MGCPEGVTDRLSDRSALFPTSTIITSFPRSDRTSSIHFAVDMNDCRSRKRRSEDRQSLELHERALACDIKNDDCN